MGLVTTKPLNGGTQKIYRFTNGYGASVVQHDFSYTDEGEWELAVIRFEEGADDNDFHLTYSTPITDDVIGHLDDEDVNALLKRIKKLPEA